MWFLFGLLIGASMTGNGGMSAGPAGQIPLRCYAAIDNDAAYRSCRYASMMGELMSATRAYNDGSLCYYTWTGRERNYDLGKSVKETGTCDIDAAIVLELKALRKLDEMAKAKHQ